MILVKFGKEKYHLDLDYPKIIYDSCKKRISEKDIFSKTALSSEEFWKILHSIQSTSKSSNKTLSYQDLKELVFENFEHSSMGQWKIPESDFKVWIKGINYAVCPSNDRFKILELLTKILQNSSCMKWRHVSVSHPGANKIKWSPRIKNLIMSPYGSCDSSGISSIPLMVPVLAQQLLVQDQNGK